MKIMSTDEYLEKYWWCAFDDLGTLLSIRRPRAKMADGFEMSIQGSKFHYCTPREDIESGFTELELGFPSEVDRLIAEYAEDEASPTGTVYPHVPVEVVDELIRKHGGIVEAMFLDVIEENCSEMPCNFIFSWKENKE